MPSEAGSDGAASPDNVIDLVDTIQVPRKFNDLTKKLPPPRYDVTPAVLDAVEANLQRPRVARENPARKPEQRLPELPALNPVAEGAAAEAAVAARRLKEQQRLKEKQREDQRAARHEHATRRSARPPRSCPPWRRRRGAMTRRARCARARRRWWRRRAARRSAQQQQAQGALAQARQVYGAQAPPPGHPAAARRAGGGDAGAPPAAVGAGAVRLVQPAGDPDGVPPPARRVEGVDLQPRLVVLQPDHAPADVPAGVQPVQAADRRVQPVLEADGADGGALALPLPEQPVLEQPAEPPPLPRPRAAAAAAPARRPPRRRPRLPRVARGWAAPAPAKACRRRRPPSAAPPSCTGV